MLVDQVLRRPVLVRVRAPRLVVVVERDGPGDAEVVRRAADVRRHVLERELRRVHADDLEPVCVVGRVPGAQVRQRAQAVDARVRPEVDQHDLAAQRRERRAAVARRVQPVRDAGEVRRRAEHRQRARRRAAAACAANALPPPRSESSRFFAAERVLDVLLQRRRVAAERRLQALVGVEHDRERGSRERRRPSPGGGSRCRARSRRATRWPPSAISSIGPAAPSA